MNRWRQQVLYPNQYTWFVLVAVLDLLVTSMLLVVGGGEANPLANWLLTRWGLYGLLVFKLAIVCLVVVLCEMIGRHAYRRGRRVAEWAVALNCIPVIFGGLQLALRVGGVL